MTNGARFVPYAAHAKSHSPQVAAHVTLSLLQPNLRSIEHHDDDGLCWTFLKLIDKLPPSVSLQSIQGLARKVKEWMQLNSECKRSVVDCFAAAVLEKSISICHDQENGHLECDVWFRRLAGAHHHHHLPAAAASGPVGIPRLLLMLMSKGQFLLLDRILEYCGGNVGGLG